MHNIAVLVMCSMSFFYVEYKRCNKLLQFSSDCSEIFMDVNKYILYQVS